MLCEGNNKGVWIETQYLSFTAIVSKPNSTINTNGIKSKAVEKAAKWLAAKVGSKSVVEITDYLFDWKDDLEDGCINYLKWDSIISYAYHNKSS